MAARKCCAAGPVGPLPSWRTPTVPYGPAERGVSPPTAGGGWGPWMNPSSAVLAQDVHSIIGSQMPENIPSGYDAQLPDAAGLSTAFLQLSYPWLKTTG